jgi:acetylglutamate kinase
MTAPVATGGTEELDIGLVGEVAAVNPMVIEALDRSDIIPVIAPVGVGDGGETYNINADLVAGKVAEALRAEKLILLTDVEGIKDGDGNVVPTLDDERARQLIADGTIGEGMIPKVECCLEALKNGVKKTHIVDGRLRHAVLLEIFTREGVGTEVVRSRRNSGGRGREPRRVGARGQ